MYKGLFNHKIQSPVHLSTHTKNNKMADNIYAAHIVLDKNLETLI
jgi:hypothetical protein